MDLERGEFGGGGAGRGAGQMREIAADQQEEGQHQRRVEEGMGAGMHRLPERDAEGEQDRGRDRHVHVETAGAQREEGVAEEGQGGEGDRRQGDQRRDPVQEVAGRVARPGPDRDREQHDVHQREARDGDPGEQVAAGGVDAGGFERGAVERAGGEAERIERGDQAGLDAGRVLGGHGDALQGQVDPGAVNLGMGGEAALDAGDAGRAVDRGQGKLDPAQRHVARPGGPAPDGGRVGHRGAGGAGHRRGIGGVGHVSCRTKSAWRTV
jgi:hypothetical protein